LVSSVILSGAAAAAAQSNGPYSPVILSKATSEVAASKDPPRVRQPTVFWCDDGKRSDLRTRGGFFDFLADSVAQNDREWETGLGRSG